MQGAATLEPSSVGPACPDTDRQRASGLPNLSADAASALRDLEEARQTLARLEHLSPRPMTPGLSVLLWGIRLYVIGTTGILAAHILAVR